MEAERHDVALRLFAAVAAKDIEAALACFAPGSVIVDPHYPTPTMRGHAAIADGLRWAFGVLEQMRFTPRHICVSENGRVLAIETVTQHTVRGGRQLRFAQTFVIEIDNRLITRLQAYPSYGPNGIGGVALRFERIRRRIAFLLRCFAPRSRDPR